MTSIQTNIDWPVFMARHDLLWTQPAASWAEGAFLGNGLLGVMIYHQEDGSLRLDIGRSDVAEHRPDGDVYDGQHRLLIGSFRLCSVGQVIATSMRLRLWDAEAVGTLTTDRGALTWRCLVHADKLVIIAEFHTSGDENDARWIWHPEPAVSPHRLHRSKPISTQTRNPAPRIAHVGDGQVSIQELLAGGGHATAWAEDRPHTARRTLWMSIGNSHSGTAAGENALGAVNEARGIGLPTLLAAHRQWWHAYYPASFVSVPDARLESFYWIQLYKLASATRAERQVLDLMGPWPAVTVWPGIWWNLNIQLCYWPVYRANHLELGESLCGFLDRNIESFIQNVPKDWQHDSAGVDVQTGYGCRQAVSREFCNLTWVCHNYFLQYRYSMDERVLRRLYPLLRRAIGYYLHILVEGGDGTLHVPKSRSPEYPVLAEDTNVNLALIRWGCQTLLWINDTLRLADPAGASWRQTLERLVDYPVGPDGFLIGKDVPLRQSHRHYSHLLMVYPLFLFTPDRKENRALIEKSLRHWIGFEGALQGYTFTGAASLFAVLGYGDEARDMLNACVDRYIQPNTMYLEWESPVLETPLSGAASVQDMLLQCRGDVIHVFPAIPSDWDEVCVHDLRAEGAFLISAGKAEGQLAWIRVQSLAGQRCLIKADWPAGVEASGRYETRPDGLLELFLAAGEEMLLTAKASTAAPIVAPVSTRVGEPNWFGQRKRREIDSVLEPAQPGFAEV